MILKQWSKSTTYLLMLGLGLTMTGCSGGGDDSAGLHIDTSNQQQVLATLFDSIDNTTPQLPPKQEDASSDEAEHSLSQLLSSPKEAVAQENSTAECSDGGLIYSSEEDGKSIISYENCEEAGTTTNGTVTVAYNESTNEVIYTLTDYTLQREDREYMTSLTTYTLSDGNIAYTSTGRATTDGSIIEFNGYNYTLNIVDNRLNISVNGLVKTDALGDWMSIKTTKAMQISDSCPTIGEVAVQGGGSTLNVLFKSDQSLDVFLNDTLAEQYADCNKLPAVQL